MLANVHSGYHCPASIGMHLVLTYVYILSHTLFWSLLFPATGAACGPLITGWVSDDFVSHDCELYICVHVQIVVTCVHGLCYLISSLIGLGSCILCPDDQLFLGIIG